MKFAWIEANRSTFSVKGMCSVLDVSQSGLYDFLSRPESDRSQKDLEIVDEIKTIHEEVDGIYGSPRMTIDSRQGDMK